MGASKNSRTLNCYNCNSLLLDTSLNELKKLIGLNFRCDCCGHENRLTRDKFVKGSTSNDPYSNTIKVEKLLLMKN